MRDASCIWVERDGRGIFDNIRQAPLGVIEGTYAVPLYFLLEARLLHGFRNQVHGPAQGGFEALAQLVEAADVIKSPRGGCWIERHGQVDIRFFRRVAAGRRAEQRQAHDAERSELGFTALQGGDNCVRSIRAMYLAGAIAAIPLK